MLSPHDFFVSTPPLSYNPRMAPTILRPLPPDWRVWDTFSHNPFFFPAVSFLAPFFVVSPHSAHQDFFFRNRSRLVTSSLLFFFPPVFYVAFVKSSSKSLRAASHFFILFHPPARAPPWPVPVWLRTPLFLEHPHKDGNQRVPSHHLIAPFLTYLELPVLLLSPPNLPWKRERFPSPLVFLFRIAASRPHPSATLCFFADPHRG